MQSCWETVPGQGLCFCQAITSKNRISHNAKIAQQERKRNNQAEDETAVARRGHRLIHLKKRPKVSNSAEPLNGRAVAIKSEADR